MRIVLPALPKVERKKKPVAKPARQVDTEIPQLLVAYGLKQSSLHTAVNSCRRLLHLAFGFKVKPGGLNRFLMTKFLEPGAPKQVFEALADQNNQRGLLSYLLIVLRVLGFEGTPGFAAYSAAHDNLRNSATGISAKDIASVQQLKSGDGKISGWQYVWKKYEELKTKADDAKFADNFPVQRDFVLFSCMVLQPPPRQQELVDTRITHKKIDELKIANGALNFLSVSECKWARLVHKTVGRKGVLITEVPPKLCEIIARFSEHFKTDILIPSETNHQVPMRATYFVRVINRLLGTDNVSTQMLRKLYISEVQLENPDLSIEDKLNIARLSGHSLVTQQNYARLLPLLRALGLADEHKDSAEAGADEKKHD